MRDNRLQDFVDADPIFGAGEDRFLRRDGQDVLDLLFHGFHVRAGQVDLVDHGDELEALFVGQMHVGNGLGLHSLGRVDDEQRALAGGQAARHFIRKIHVARRVDEVKKVSVACSSTCSSSRPGAP